ncbi:MAG: HAD-IC family P-type ATPase [Clostridia bacterium]|nr:HAD-IC family P-type ATPase [Clostridia bacterium]
MNNWHSLDISNIYDRTGSSINGLNASQVKEKQEKYGKNILPKEKKDSFLKIFLSQFYSAIVIVMIFAAIFSFAAGEIVDGIAIVIIIFVDAIVGTFQEWNAGKEAESLQNLIKVKSKVIREGKEKVIDSADLVVGDIVLLESGDKVSGDLRIIECYNLTIDESVLTGESVAACKNEEIIDAGAGLTDRANMAFGGTSVVTGRATCIVVETGVNTEIGKISSKVVETKAEKSPLTIRIEKLSKQITMLVLIIAILITLIMIYKGEEIANVFISVVALSVSAMPEGLPLALTLALTIGSRRMAKRNVVVKKLNSVESLGSCTVIASDKTGTLTVNEQTAKKIILADGSSFEVEGVGYNGEGKVLEINGSKISNAIEIGKLGVINNEATLQKVNDKWESHGDSIDIAFLSLGEKLNVGSSFKVLKEMPYESEKKYSAVFYHENDDDYCTIKGSPETVLSFCDAMYVDGKISNLNIGDVVKQNDALACEGYRVIALAKSRKLQEVPKAKILSDSDIPKMIFVGLVAFIDPIRKETIDSVNKCKKAGIKVIMVTGDHPLTAFSIAKELGICESLDNVATGDDIEKRLAMGEKEFDKYVKNIKVFTRVTPLQKLEIVNSLKRQGEFVAVTGDGVNDAPAIKSANIGIAMGSGTDVAKETSKMIIVDDDFMSIVSGIEEGRNAYSNIRKVVYLLLSCGLSEVFFFAISIFLGLPVPLIAVQLLWLNIVTDGLQDMALSFEREEKEIMNEKPRSPKESIFDKLMFQEVMTAGLVMGVSVLALWIYLVKVANIDIPLARSYVMMLMVFMQNLHALNCRSEKISAFKIPLSRNWFILFSIVSSILLQIIVMENSLTCSIFGAEKLPYSHVLLMFLCSIPILLIMEIFKIIKFRKR